jgi:prevent-host-death family protein
MQTRFMKDTVLQASEFKAKCLHLLDEVAGEGKVLVITKHGRPVARVSPVTPAARTLRGTWRDSVRIHGDIVHFGVENDWESNR